MFSSTRLSNWLYLLRTVQFISLVALDVLSERKWFLNVWEKEGAKHLWSSQQNDNDELITCITQALSSSKIYFQSFYLLLCNNCLFQKHNLLVAKSKGQHKRLSHTNILLKRLKISSIIIITSWLRSRNVICCSSCSFQ